MISCLLFKFVFCIIVLALLSVLSYVTLQNLDLSKVMGTNASQEERNYTHRYKSGLILAGFMRNVKLKQDVPIDINLYDICFRFYFINEHFDSKLKGDKMILNDDELECYSCDNYEHTLFGVNECGENKEIYSWKLQVVKTDKSKMKPDSWMCGVIKSNKEIKTKVLNTFFTNISPVSSYGIYCNSNYIKCKKINSGSVENGEYGPVFNNEGDIVEIKFDSLNHANCHLLSFKINNEDCGIAYEIEKRI